jgi:hypothetical protein
VCNLISMFSLPPRERVLISYAAYEQWKEYYYGLHKEHPVKAGEVHGRAFCQAHLIHDKELEASENRIISEAIIFSRYVDRHRVLN